ncbi:MAG TPA: chorismate synthase [Spirochaetia bacterium]|nr:MAG: chorismate synthase [Spirochaetes bacterium GWB1_36_13]HCL55960.1 chorismate synthase [Spirochaetia bacterium]
MSSPFEYITSGESHGPGLTAVIKNIPAGFKISSELINYDLERRQKGYGRGGRMKIEKDQVQILGGIRNNETTGTPLSLFIPNHDYKNWEGKKTEPITRPRPGHADLVGGIKYQREDLRDILERSSARETAVRTAVGSVAKQLLSPFQIQTASFVETLGGIEALKDSSVFSILEIQKITENSELRLLNPDFESKIKSFIDTVKENGDTLGGTIVVLADGIPPALGSFAMPETKLDSRIAAAFLSLQAIKGIEFGIGRQYAYLKGSEVHDEIFYNEKGFYRKTNRAGGIEGGMSNGERIFLKAFMKPIPTLMKPLLSVDIHTKKAFEAVKERSDVTAVPAAAVVGEALLAIEIAKAFFERFGMDNQNTIMKNFIEDQRKFEWLE